MAAKEATPAGHAHLIFEGKKNHTRAHHDNVMKVIGRVVKKHGGDIMWKKEVTLNDASTRGTRFDSFTLPKGGLSVETNYATSGEEKPYLQFHVFVTGAKEQWSFKSPFMHDLLVELRKSFSMLPSTHEELEGGQRSYISQM